MRQIHYLVAGVLLALLVGLVPAQAQDGVVWRYDLYDNPYLLGSSKASGEVHGPLTLDWGFGPPADGIPEDNFSGRFGTSAYFEAGTWRFNVLADDGVILRVNNQVLIDTYDVGRAAFNLTADVQLSAGFHNVQVDFREGERTAYLFVNWQRADVPVNPESPLVIISGPEITRGRWKAEYFNNTTLSGFPAFSNDTPSPMANWGSDAPVEQVNPEGFSARFTRQIELEGGRYRATVKADDGVRFYFNGQLLINQFGPAQNIPYTADFDASEGDHTIVIEYVEYGGLAFLDFNLIRLQNQLGEPIIGAGPIPVPVPEQNAATQPGGNPGGVPAPAVPPAPQPTAVPTNVTATITASTVYVRSEPRVANGNIVSIVSQGQTYTVIGRANNGWVELQVGGTTGWISGKYADTPNLLSVPITGQGPTS